MKHRLVNKIRSRRGASLFLALLLFAVCAVVGIVVLVASTTAAGRAAGLAKMDRRYYSVMSAAEIVKDTFAAKETKFTVEVDKDGEIKSVECDDTGGLLTQWSTYVLVSNGDQSDAAFSAKLVAAMTDKGWPSAPTEEMKNGRFTLTIPDVDTDLDAEVTIGQDTLTSNNPIVFTPIVFTIYNVNKDNGQDDLQFKLKIYGTADILKEEVPYLAGTKTASDGTELSKTVYYTVTWSFSDVAR